MALAIDASSPVVAVNTSTTTLSLATASFTPPANSLLVVLWAGDEQSGGGSSTPTVSGGSLTYTLRQWKANGQGTPALNGQAAIWTAPVASSAAMTVTVNNNTVGSFREAALRVLVLTDSSQPTVGTSSKGGQSSGTAVPMAYTATQTGSWGFAAISDWDAKGTETAGTGTTLLSSGTSGGVSYGFFRRTTADGSSGVTTTLNATLPTASTNLAWAAVEILPAAGGAAPGIVPTARARRRGTRRIPGWRGNVRTTTPDSGTRPPFPKRPAARALPRLRRPLPSVPPPFVSGTLTSTLDLIATNGTAPTTGNSNISASANNAAPTLFASTDIAPPHSGTTVTKFTMSVSTAALVAWDTTKWTAVPSGTTIYQRFYLYLAALPVGTVGLSAYTNAALSASSSVRLQATGKLQAFATTSTSLGVMTTVIPTSQWVRIETATLMDATSGTVTIKLYLTAESLTPDETFVSSAGNTLNAQRGIDRVVMGSIGGGTSATHYFADSAWSNTGYLGPLGSVIPPTIPTFARVGRRTLAPARRGRTAQVVPAQLVAAPVVYPPAPPRVRRVAALLRRPAVGAGTPPPAPAPVVAPASARVRRGPLRRNRPPAALSATLSAQTPLAGATARVRQQRPSQRRRTTGPVPTQQTAPTNPPITATVFGRLRTTGRIRPRTKVSNPTPTQQTAPTNPPITATVFGRLRTVGRTVRRSAIVTPVHAQRAPVTNATGRLRVTGRTVRRGRVSQPTPPQTAVTAPALTARVFGRLRSIGRLIRRGKLATPVRDQVIPPSVTAGSIRGTDPYGSIGTGDTAGPGASGAFRGSQSSGDTSGAAMTGDYQGSSSSGDFV